MSDYEIRDLSDDELEVIRKLTGKDDVTSVHIDLGSGDDLLFKHPSAKVTPIELPEEIEKAFAAAACNPPCQLKRRGGRWVCVCP